MDQEKSEQIERYLSGDMPATERGAFEAALQHDPDLAEALSLARALQQSLGNRQRRHLLDTLADVVEQEEAKRPAGIQRRLLYFQLAAAAAVLALAAIGTWLYFRPDDRQPGVVERPAAQQQAVPDSIPVTTPQTPAPQQPEPDRLALADFSPNPALDPLAGTLVRGGGMAINITQPENDAVFPIRDGKINFTLKGESKDETALTLQIYNNREADFAAGKPVYRTDLLLQDQVFSTTTRMKLSPGRYYAVLYAPGEEEPVAVLRFFAGSRK